MCMNTRLPLNNLNTFAAAAKTLSFKGAAQGLHVTPSAVSHQIRNLEGLLGYALFERLDKRVMLTGRGQHLFQEIRAPLRQLHQASLNALRGTGENRLALSVAPVFATRWLLPRLKTFYDAHPEINLSVIATSSLVEFHSDPFDAAIRLGRGEWPSTRVRRLFPKRLVAVCHPSLLPRAGTPLAAESLLAHPLIHNTSMQSGWRDWFASAGVVFDSVLTGMEVPSSAQVLEAVVAGGTVGLVDRAFIDSDLVTGHIALACDHELRDDEGYYLTWPDGAVSPPALEHFAEWLFSELDGAGTVTD